MLVAKPGVTVNWRAGEKEDVRKGKSEMGEEGQSVRTRKERDEIFDEKSWKI